MSLGPGCPAKPTSESSSASGVPASAPAGLKDRKGGGGEQMRGLFEFQQELQTGWLVRGLTKESIKIITGGRVTVWGLLK